MFFSDIVPTIDHYVSLITRCVAKKRLKLGMTILSHLIKTALASDSFIVNHLIGMYSRCSSIRSAHKAFDDLDIKNSHSWNTIISAYARIGDFKKALALFDEMPQRTLVSYNSLISGLSRHGFYVDSLIIFLHMQKECDCLSMELIESASNKSNHVGMWGAVLGACKVRGNLVIARKAVDALLNLEPRSAARYVMLSSVYAATNGWDDSCRVRKQMDERDLTKDVASSWIEVKNEMHKFPSKDQFHYQIGDLNEVLGKLAYHTKEAGYVPEPNLRLVLDDDDDDGG